MMDGWFRFFFFIGFFSMREVLPVLSRTPFNTAATRSSAGVSLSPPFLALVIGVLRAHTTTTSSSVFPVKCLLSAPCLLFAASMMMS